MSTRACIARATGEGTFVGVYHHWDGYPSGLGATLWELYHGFFGRDLARMLAYLIDEHPAGWSTIDGADFNAKPGFHEGKFTSTGPQCYCHGGRHESAQPITQDDDAGMEWAYVFDPEQRVMYVLERVYRDDAGEGETLSGKSINLAGKHMTGMFGMGAPGKQRWADAARIELEAEREPKWDEISAQHPLSHVAEQQTPKRKQMRRRKAV